MLAHDARRSRWCRRWPAAWERSPARASRRSSASASACGSPSSPCSLLLCEHRRDIGRRVRGHRGRDWSSSASRASSPCRSAAARRVAARRARQLPQRREGAARALARVRLLHRFGASWPSPTGGRSPGPPWSRSSSPTPAFLALVIAHDRHDHRTVDAVLRAEQHRRQGHHRQGAGRSQRVDVIVGAVVANVIACAIIVTTGTGAAPRRHRRSRAPHRPQPRSTPVAGRYAHDALRGRTARSLDCWLPPCCRSPPRTRSARRSAGRRGLDRSWSEAPIFNGIYTFVIVVRRGGVILLPDLNLISDHALLADRQRRAAAVPAALHDQASSNDRRIMGRHINGRVYNFFSWATVLIVIALTVAVLVMTALGLG